MIRYCLTERAKLRPCGVSWGTADTTNGMKSCYDEPQEENCRMLVDEHIRQTCPYCGNVLQQPTQPVPAHEYIIGQNIRDAIEDIKGR